MEEKAHIARLMSNPQVSSFVKENIHESLKNIGFSENLIFDLIESLPGTDITAFQKRHAKELTEIYTLNFFQKIVPDYFEKYLLPLVDSKGTILDIGCGTGILAKRLHERNKGKKIIGVDINPYPEWKQFSTSQIEFRVIKEDQFESFLKQLQPEEIVLTWTLHHMNYEEQIRYLALIYKNIPQRTTLTIVEDAFSTTLAPLEGPTRYEAFKKLLHEERKAVMSIYDWIANRILAQRSKIPIPFAYRTLEEWITLCEKAGFTIKEKKFIGFPNQRDINTPQSIFRIAK